MKKPAIIFEDDVMVVLNKPSGILSIPDRYDQTRPNLKQILSKRNESVFVVHRLDVETSGVICFAKNEHAHKNLSTQFADRTVRKKYVAIVKGKVADDEGYVDEALLLDEHSHRMMIHPKGKTSLTKYKVIERYAHHTLLELEIVTGRTHQIRAHMQFIGHPLLVDPQYGSEGEFFVSSVKGRKYRLGKGKTEMPLLSRVSLHSKLIEITHPENGQRLELEAKLPKDLRACIAQLRKWDPIHELLD